MTKTQLNQQKSFIFQADTFYIVRYYIKEANTYWTYSRWLQEGVEMKIQQILVNKYNFKHFKFKTKSQLI